MLEFWEKHHRDKNESWPVVRLNDAITASCVSKSCIPSIIATEKCAEIVG
jgi:hypothetical protein